MAVESLLVHIVEHAMYHAAWDVGRALGLELHNAVFGSRKNELVNELVSIAQSEPMLVRFLFCSCARCGYGIGNSAVRTSSTADEAIRKVQIAAMVSYYRNQAICGTCGQCDSEAQNACSNLELPEYWDVRRAFERGDDITDYLRRKYT